MHSEVQLTLFYLNIKFYLKLHNFNPLSRKMQKSYVRAGPDGLFSQQVHVNTSRLTLASFHYGYLRHCTCGAVRII